MTNVMENLIKFIQDERLKAAEELQDYHDNCESGTLQSFFVSGEINAYEKILAFINGIGE